MWNILKKNGKLNYHKTWLEQCLKIEKKYDKTAIEIQLKYIYVLSFMNLKLGWMFLHLSQKSDKNIMYLSTIETLPMRPHLKALINKTGL